METIYRILAIGVSVCLGLWAYFLSRDIPYCMV